MPKFRALPQKEWVPRSHNPECVKMYVNHHDGLAVRQIIYELVAEAARLEGDGGRDRAREIIDSLYDAITVDWNTTPKTQFTKGELESLGDHLRWCLKKGKEIQMTSFTAINIFDKVNQRLLEIAAEDQ